MWIRESEYRIIRNSGDFKRMLQEELGQEAADYFEECLPEGESSTCNGECDAVYELQEFMEILCQDALDELDLLQTKKGFEKHLERVRTILRNGLS